MSTILSESSDTTVPACGYYFQLPSYMFADVKYNLQAVPLAFKITPDTLTNLSANALDLVPKSRAFHWHIDEVINWLTGLGYAQYEHCFRKNLITGRKLLLIDAAALLSMRINNFKHVKDICQNIRKLFQHEFQLLSALNESCARLYKLYCTRTGAKYSRKRASDFFLNATKAQHLNDWSLLEQHLNYRNSNNSKILIGGIKQHKTIKYYYNTKLVDAATNAELSELYDSLMDYDIY